MERAIGGNLFTSSTIRRMIVLPQQSALAIDLEAVLSLSAADASV
jgi:hypothetical protein